MPAEPNLRRQRNDYSISLPVDHFIFPQPDPAANAASAVAVLRQFATPSEPLGLRLQSDRRFLKSTGMPSRLIGVDRDSGSKAITDCGSGALSRLSQYQLQ
jgi:hypothetical protein